MLIYILNSSLIKAEKFLLAFNAAITILNKEVIEIAQERKALFLPPSPEMPATPDDSVEKSSPSYKEIIQEGAYWFMEPFSYIPRCLKNLLMN